MKPVRLQIGLELTFRKRKFRIEETLDSGEFKIVDIANNDFYLYRYSEILNMVLSGNMILHSPYDSGDAVLPKEVSDLNDNQRNKQYRRLCYVNEAIKKSVYSVSEELQDIIDDVAKEINDESKPSPSTVYNWNRKFRESNNDPMSLVDQDWSLTGQHYKYDDSIEFMVGVATKYIKSHMQPKISKIREIVIAEIHIRNKRFNEKSQWPIPSERHFRRIYDRYVDNYYKLAAEKGEPYARQYFSVSEKSRPESFPLSTVEIDDTPSDAIVIDDDTCLIYGRPTLTLGIDRFSTAPWGMDLDWDKPGVDPVLRCIEHGLKPKDYVAEDYADIVHKWPVCGQPGAIFVDRGPGFKSDSLKDIGISLGLDIHLQNRRKPWQKGKVERFFREISENVEHVQPGTTLHNTLETHYGYDPTKHAVVTLNELRYKLHLYIIDYYLQKTKKDTIGMSPIKKWNIGFEIFKPLVPSSQHPLHVLCNRVAHRKIGKDGIRFNNLSYDSPKLKSLLRQINRNEDVKLKWKRSDLSLIWVYDKYKVDYIPVPSTDPEYTKDLHQIIHKQIRKMSLEEYRSDDIIHLSMTRRKIEHSVNDTFRRRKSYKKTKKGTNDKYLKPPKPKKHSKHIPADHVSSTNYDNLLDLIK